MFNIKKQNNNTMRILLIVFLVCLICSAMVASVAIGLKSKQNEQIKLDTQRNILIVAGLSQSKITSNKIQELYNKYIEKRILNLKTNKLYNNISENYDMKNKINKNETDTSLSSEEDYAKIYNRPNNIEIYLVKNNFGKISQIILPIYGSGLWSIMYAFISIDRDAITSRGITFYSHGETPGLGGEIDNTNWKKQWAGKKLFNEKGDIIIKITNRGIINSDHNVDGLSGATLTSNGIQNMFNFWLGDKGFGPFLKKIREEHLNNDQLKRNKINNN
ncbi:Na(+)-translocating NADH-quinone reductase subunit C [Candidatus Providencia siddallii]|uniref:Na(+)-translocating NADH-quinone reductase subunit C n=1 Tax=Candidatus Providencia siddallii TaxID=1715285 RepID=A0A0M6W719_9GAMM|nr:Na(+)-translocating NADH-quinone reductase subunit C [Candidatus Providencia siddallii]